MSEPVAVGSPRVRLSAVFSSPVGAFAALRDRPSAILPLRLILLTLPVVPVVGTLATIGPLRTSLIGQSGEAATASVVVVAASFAVILMLMQVVLLVAHFVVFALLVRLSGSPASFPLVRAVWCYAVVPLVFRQLTYLGVALIAGPNWFNDRSAWLSLADPFLLWAAVLFYIAARNALGLSRMLSWAVCLMSTLVGAVPGFLQLLQ